ncbi:44746_t:CDS:2, partial [Gigaspora margarita]
VSNKKFSSKCIKTEHFVGLATTLDNVDNNVFHSDKIFDDEEIKNKKEGQKKYVHSSKHRKGGTGRSTHSSL